MKGTEKFSRRRFLAGSAGATALLGLPAMAAPPPTLPYYQNRGWLVGCWTRPWSQYDYREGFDAMAQAGFKYVALSGAKSPTGRVISPKTSLAEAAQVGEEARKRGLTITTVYGGDTPLEKGPEGLRKMIENCRAAGAWSVLVANLGTEKKYEASCRTVAATADFAVQNGVVLVLKPHGGLISTGPQLRDAVRRVNHKVFTVMYDPGNIFFYSGGKLNPVNDCEAIRGMVTGLSVKDYRSPKEVMLVPGTGQVDFPGLLKKLRAGGFTHGPLMIETLPLGDRPQILAAAKNAKAFVEGLVAG